MRRIGMGLVGPGFVAAHHIDAVRRLGFVDVVAIADVDEGLARQKAEKFGVGKVHTTFEALAADPTIDVIHNTTPNFLHGRVVRAALAYGKHIVSEKPLAPSAEEAHTLWCAAKAIGVVHAVTFNYRGNPMVQHARAMVERGDIGAVHFVQGAYLQDWLLKPTDFSWRLVPETGGPSSAFADIGSHWCDLVEHVAGRRIEALLADLTTVIGTRYRPAESREAFAKGSGGLGEPFRVQSEDLATIVLRFEGGAKGCVSVGQVCAGHKNDLWFELSGASGSLRWRQEQQNELWIGRRDEPNVLMTKDPALLHPSARAYARLPAGHQEAWSDAFCNVIRDIYTCIANGNGSAGSRPPAFATFEDGYRSACLVEAILESHRRGGAWTNVHANELVGGSR